jgi:5-hydroxyisourate hydrolase
MTISTHVLDTSKGAPAAGIAVVLEHRAAADSWQAIGHGTTDPDGRLRDLVQNTAALQPGVYRLIFDTRTYFRGQGISSFHPSVIIVFETTGDEHYHVPVLLSPFGYTTYRGS